MKIVYISVDNRCRSILAEAITEHVSEGLVDAESAGIDPDQSIYPAVYGFLRQRQISTLELKTKSVDELLRTLDPKSVDVVVSLSPKLKRESLKQRFPNSEIVKIAVNDLSHSSATDDQLREYFENIVDSIEFRLRKAIIENEKPASGTRGRAIVNKAGFIKAFCQIEHDTIETGKKPGGKPESKAQANAEKNEDEKNVQVVEEKNIEKSESQ